MKRTVSLHLVSLAAIAAFQTITPAFAAEAAAVDAAAVDEADRQDNSGLIDIVVTATKRETNLQDTPIAIAVMSDEDLKKSLLDIFDAMPGHIFFVCPSNPVAKWCKSMFGWQYTKKQNKHNWPHKFSQIGQLRLLEVS